MDEEATLRHLREIIRAVGNTEQISQMRSDTILRNWCDVTETLRSSIGLSFEEAAQVLIPISFDLQSAYRSFWVHRCQDTEDEDRFKPSGEDVNNMTISALFAGRVNMVKRITGVDDNHAIAALSNNKWIVEKALAFVYNDLSAKPTSFPRQLDAVFLQYEDKQTGKIDLRVPPFSRDAQLDTDPHERFKTIVVLSWHMRAASFGQVSMNEFVVGMLNLRMDSIVELKQKIPEIRSELRNPQKFKEIYEFSFSWFSVPHREWMTVKEAINLWTLLFTDLPQPWPLQRDWFHYLQSSPEKSHIHKDTWTHILTFCRTIEPDLSNYNAGDNWAFLIIDFVDQLTSIQFRSSSSSSDSAHSLTNN